MIFGESLSKRNQLRPSTRTARGRKTALFVPIELDEGRSTQIELNEGRSRSIEVNECRSRSIELDRVSSSSIEVNRVSSSSIEVNRVSSSSIQMSSNELDRAGKKRNRTPSSATWQPWTVAHFLQHNRSQPTWYAVRRCNSPRLQPRPDARPTDQPPHCHHRKSWAAPPRGRGKRRRGWEEPAAGSFFLPKFRIDVDEAHRAPGNRVH